MDIKNNNMGHKKIYKKIFIKKKFFDILLQNNFVAGGTSSLQIFKI
jgi:hypothetical protein